MIESGKVYVTSNSVADKFQKEHRNLMRNIRSLIDSQPEFGAFNFERTKYTTGQNKSHDCYNMTRDGFAMIAMSLTGREAEAWKIKYISAFNSMESALKSNSLTMKSFNELVKKAESDKAVASACGSELSKYKKVKKDNEIKINETIKKVQFELGFNKV